MKSTSASESTTAISPESGAIARIERVRKNIRRMLDVDEESYKASQSRWSDEQKKAYRAEEEVYQGHCAFMSEAYIQWSSNLLLEAPLPAGEGGDGESSLIAIMSSLWPGPVGSASQSSAPQYVKEAIEKVGVLAKHRKFYLERLFDQLKPEEKTRFKPLLQIWYPPGGSLPDIKATEMYYRLEGCWRLGADHKEHHLKNVPMNQKYDEAVNAYARNSEELRTFFGSDLPARNDKTPDSLAARLLLSSLLNRGRWELAEYERFEICASTSIEKLIASLELLGEPSIPSYRGPDGFGGWVLEVLGKDSPIVASEWRPVKIQHLPRFYSCAEWIVGDLKDRDLNENDLNEELREKRNLCVLAMAWSYCTNEKHDLRVPRVKDYFLVGGRKVAAKEELAPTAVLHHRRQIETLYNTRQYLELSPERLALYSRVNMHKRLESGAFLEKTLRGKTLAQWEAISQRATQLVSDIKEDINPTSGLNQ